MLYIGVHRGRLKEKEKAKDEKVIGMDLRDMVQIEIERKQERRETSFS